MFNFNPSFLLTGAWWFGFSQYTFRYLPRFGEVKDKLPKDLVLLNFKNIFKSHGEAGGWLEVVKRNIQFYIEIIKESFKELFKVGRKLFQTPNLKYFLSSFFFYSVGMQTIFLMATLFGKSEINLAQDKLILTLLLIQIEAIVGAMIFSRLSKKIGNKNVISITVFLWVVVCVWAYFLNKANPNVEYHFYAVAGLVGMVMGGLQAMSRSTYSRLLPENSMDNTTYFSFYDALEKIAIMIGAFIFSFIIDNYSNIREFFAQISVNLPSASGMRFAAFSMGIFFLIGLVLIRFVKIKVNDKIEVL